MSMSIIGMMRMARVIVEQILGVKPREKVCIFSDTQRPQSITRLLAGSAGQPGDRPAGPPQRGRSRDRHRSIA